jgi:hypothetical protein
MDLKSIEGARFTLAKDPNDANYTLITLRLPADTVPGIAMTATHGIAVDVTGADAMNAVTRFALDHAGALMSALLHHHAANLPSTPNP